MPVPPVPALIKMGLGRVLNPRGEPVGPQPDSSDADRERKLAGMGPPPLVGGHEAHSKSGLNWNEENPDEGEGSEQNGRTVPRHQPVDATRRTQPTPNKFKLFLAGRRDVNDYMEKLTEEEKAAFMEVLREEWEETNELNHRLEAERREADNTEKIERRNRRDQEEGKRAMWKRIMEEGSGGINAVRDDGKKQSKYASAVMRFLEGMSGPWAHRNQLR